MNSEPIDHEAQRTENKMMFRYSPMACLTFCAASFFLSSTTASADLTETIVGYRDGDLELEGFLAWDPAIQGQRQGVLVVHQWMGLTDYEKRRCRELAKLGYVAFALDIYGTNNRPKDRGEAGQAAGKYKTDRELYRHRLNLGLQQLREHMPNAKAPVAAIGYCFGGTGVLELARSGADVDGVVSFHGGLDSPTPADGQKIQGKILVCHGADDPFVPAKDIAAFKKELNDADVDWQMIEFAHAVHSFTQPMAGNDPSRGAAYNEKADKRSWQAMKLFFTEVFAGAVR